MKYKKGDRVRIKTWKELEQKYGLSSNGNMPAPPSADGTFFAEGMEVILKRNFPDRILIIEEIRKNYYKMEGICYGWLDYMIEGLAEDECIIFEIISRFELMDFEL